MSGDVSTVVPNGAETLIVIMPHSYLPTRLRSSLPDLLFFCRLRRFPPCATINVILLGLSFWLRFPPPFLRQSASPVTPPPRHLAACSRLPCRGRCVPVLSEILSLFHSSPSCPYDRPQARVMVAPVILPPSFHSIRMYNVPMI